MEMELEMESDDEDTILYDIEVVTSSSSTSLDSSLINESNNPKNEPQQIQQNQNATLIEVENVPNEVNSDANSRLQADQNEPAQVSSAEEDISDEQRYAELIKEIGEFKLVGPLPSQSDTASPPEASQPSAVEEHSNAEKEEEEEEEREDEDEEPKELVEQQVDQSSTEKEHPLGDDNVESARDSSHLDEVETVEVVPELALTEEADKDEQANSGEDPGELAEQPSATEPMIPLDEPESRSEIKQTQIILEVPAIEEEKTVGQAAEQVDEVVAEEPEQNLQPTSESEVDPEDNDLIMTKNLNNLDTVLAKPCEVTPESIESAKEPATIEPPNEQVQESELDVEEISSPSIAQEPPEQLDLQPPSPKPEAEPEQVVDDAKIDSPKSEPVELSQVPLDAEVVQERTEIEQMNYASDDGLPREIIIEADECEPDETIDSEVDKNQVDIIIEQSENIEPQPIEIRPEVPSEMERRLSRDSVGSFGGEDLEWEFDNEPVFERRDVQVKRNRDPREDYELGDELGRGRFGTVYRCVEQSSGRKLAAKFVHMRRREDREDVEREVKIMSLLQHKRLLQLYDALDDGKSEMCLITELVEGGELFERIVNDDFELTEKKAAIFMRQICEGVEYMHSQRIVHLDMKPENILCVSKTGNRIKLIDFGLARVLKEGEPLRVMFGTPDFAAPEVLAYDTVSLLTDMWSVGVICYVLLSGLSPFMGDNDMETMANVTRATFDFEDSSFDPISDLAKDFISKLLVSEQFKRLKPTECLRHPWLQRGGVQLEASVRERRESIQLATLQEFPLDQATLFNNAATGTPPLQVSLDKRNLKKYVVRRKWHKTVHAIMALGRMGANLKSRLAG